ncbi:DUF7289 family protein [Geoglobus acetivorans]|uniref:Flagellin n=1 Tax=Geoglobus acetivorans TaxID=565033 RepID=A0A0A7GCG3_GEOAI|nr:hypothetical protein GACE_0484 [Geoglobus acetivorans]
MNSRGVSEIVGFIIIFGIVISAITTIYISVNSKVNDAKEDVRFESMLQGFRKIQDAVESVIYGKSTKKEVRIVLSGGTLSVSSDANLHTRVVINNSTVLDSTDVLGGVEYSYPNYIMAFENGGVWVKSFDKTTIMSNPRIFIYKKNVNNETIVFVALASINGSGSAGGEGSVTLMFGLNSTEINIFDQSGYIYLSINSSYADAWKTYFDELRGYSNNTVLQTSLTGSTLNVTMYFDKLVLAKYSIYAEIQ